MDDWTVIDISTVFTFLLREVNEGKIEESELPEEEVKLKKAIHDARLKCASSPNYFILTVNMNGKGIVGDRRKLLSIIMRNFFASVIFCQELPGCFKKEVVEQCGTGGYEFVANGNQAAVTWLMEDFVGEPVNATDTSIRRIKERLDKRADIDTSEVLTRIAMVKLQRRNGDFRCAPFLAVSWHGPHIKTKTPIAKNKVFAGLVCFLREVCKEEKMSFIIGGDFNLNTLELDLDKHVFLENYELTARAESKLLQNIPGRFKYIPYKDNFVLFPWKGDIKVSSVRPFEFEDAEAPSSDLTEKDHKDFDQRKQSNTSRKDLLDHDPIVGVLHLAKQTGKWISHFRFVVTLVMKASLSAKLCI